MPALQRIKWHHLLLIFSELAYLVFSLHAKVLSNIGTISCQFILQWPCKCSFHIRFLGPHYKCSFHTSCLSGPTANAGFSGFTTSTIIVPAVVPSHQCVLPTGIPWLLLFLSWLPLNNCYWSVCLFTQPSTLSSAG